MLCTSVDGWGGCLFQTRRASSEVVSLYESLCGVMCGLSTFGQELPYRPQCQKSSQAGPLTVAASLSKMTSVAQPSISSSLNSTTDLRPPQSWAQDWAQTSINRQLSCA